MKKLLLTLATALSFATGLEAISHAETKIDFYASKTQEQIARFYLPDDHPMKKALDKIFAHPRALADKKALSEAGFHLILYKRSAHTKNAHWCLARHPKVPGYLFKLFLDNEDRLQRNEGWLNLVNRCKGAERIRNLIQTENLKYFVVPDKWLYRIPNKERGQPVVLLVTDMKLASKSVNREAYKNASKRQLEELYTILSHGYGSTFILGNHPYTRSKKFACVDTEGHVRRLDLYKVKSYFSQRGREYWNHLMETRPQYVH